MHNYIIDVKFKMMPLDAKDVVLPSILTNVGESTSFSNEKIKDIADIEPEIIKALLPWHDFGRPSPSPVTVNFNHRGVSWKVRNTFPSLDGMKGEKSLGIHIEAKSGDQPFYFAIASGQPDKTIVFPGRRALSEEQVLAAGYKLTDWPRFPAGFYLVEAETFSASEKPREVIAVVSKVLEMLDVGES